MFSEAVSTGLEKICVAPNSVDELSTNQAMAQDAMLTTMHRNEVRLMREIRVNASSTSLNRTHLSLASSPLHCCLKAGLPPLIRTSLVQLPSNLLQSIPTVTQGLQFSQLAIWLLLYDQYMIGCSRCQSLCQRFFLLLGTCEVIGSSFLLPEVVAAALHVAVVSVRPEVRN